MASTPSTGAIGVELQAAGENLNTWGDPKLNNALQVGVNMSTKWKDLTINGDYTVSETNYSTTNDTEVAFFRLVTGTVTAAFNFVMPSRNKRILVENATSYTATIKLAASSGFALPAGRIAWVTTDGTTDVYNKTANYLAATSLTNALDIPNYGQVQTIVANANLPATAGTVLNSGTDPSANYLANKVAGAGALTIATTNAGTVNEKSTFTVGALGLTAGAAQTGSFAPAVNTRYTLTKSGAVTVTLPAAPTVGDIIQLEIGGTGLVTYALNSLKYYGSTVNPTSAQEGVQQFIYHSAARGWIDA